MTDFAGDLKLSEMIEALRVELGVAVKNGEEQAIRFELGPIELEVEVAVTKKTTGSAGVEFWVVKAGADREHANAVTHRVTITLHPARADNSGPVQVSRPATSEPTSFPPRR